MKRRSFIASLVQTVAAAAVAARLVREEEITPVQAMREPLDIASVLKRNEEHLAGQIYYQKIHRSTWSKLVPKDDFTTGVRID